MLKTRVGKVTTVAVVLLVAVIGLVVGSKVHFPFLDARKSLNAWLMGDFGAGLPAGAAVEKAYWVGFRDSEEVFAIQMAPEAAAGFVGKLLEVARMKDQWRTTVLDARVSHPVYDAPEWWNNPPLNDGQAVDIIVGEGAMPRCHYLVLYSATTGRVYLVRGGR